MSARRFGFVGWKNSGKTTLMSMVVRELSSRGVNVAAVKHAHHSFDIDQKGRDSYRFRESGASEVLISGGGRWALLHEGKPDEEPTLEALVSRLSPSDLILIEGFKREPHPKIEVRRLEASSREPLGDKALNVVAIASDSLDQKTLGEEQALKTFDLNQIGEIADYILAKVGLSHV